MSKFDKLSAANINTSSCPDASGVLASLGILKRVQDDENK